MTANDGVNTFKLGQPVAVSRLLQRNSRMEYIKNAFGKREVRRWDPSPVAFDPPREGVIVGRRTLSNGHIDPGHYDEPDTYIGVYYFTAYMVCFDIWQKPLFALAEDLEASASGGFIEPLPVDEPQYDWIGLP